MKKLYLAIASIILINFSIFPQYIGGIGSGETSANLFNSALPIEISSFTVSEKKNNILLEWITTSEINNCCFFIERVKKNSITEKNSWYEIGSVIGSGNSNSPKYYSFSDRDSIEFSNLLYYRLRQVDNDGQFKYSKEIEIKRITKHSSLSQNFPNPFNPTTTITFSLQYGGFVKLKVFDLLGNDVKELLNEIKEAGYHSVNFDASQFPSGIYFYELITPAYNQTRKMLLIK